eukprot:Pgem_evm1s13103
MTKEKLKYEENSDIQPHDYGESSINSTGLTEEQTVLNPDNQCSVLRAIFNLVALTIGIGGLNMPKALAWAGYGFGVFSLVLSCLLSYYCGGVLLTRCVLEGKRSPRIHGEDDDEAAIIETYPDLGWEAAGRTGRTVAFLSAHGSNFGTAVCFVVLGIEQFQLLFPGVLPNFAWGFIFIACILPFTYIKTLTHVAYLSFFGAGSAAVFFLAVVVDSIYESSAGHVTTANYGDLSTTILPLSAGKLAQAFSMIAFSFGGGSVFPEIIRVMKQPHRFTIALACSNFIALCFYLTVGISCYFVYGHYAATMNNSIVDALPDSWPSKMVSSLILVHVLVAFLLFLNPLFRELERFTDQKPGFYSKQGQRKEYIGRFFFRNLLLGITLFVAVAIPFFSDVMALIGATTVTLANFICPSWFYLALFWPKHWMTWSKLKVRIHSNTSSKKIHEDLQRNNMSLRDGNTNNDNDNNSDDDKNNINDTDNNVNNCNDVADTQSVSGSSYCKKELETTPDCVIVNFTLKSDDVAIDLLEADNMIGTDNINDKLRREITMTEFIVNVFIICFTSFTGIMGLIGSVSAIVNDLKTQPFFS